MSVSEMQKQAALSWLSGASMTYIDELYENYLADKSSVPEDWRHAFDQLPVQKGGILEQSSRTIQDWLQSLASDKRVSHTRSEDAKQYQVAQLINAYRTQGHLAAVTNPLGNQASEPVPTLELSYHHLNEADKNQVFYTSTYINGSEMPLSDMIEALKNTYCNTIGIEYMHISDDAARQWFQVRMEKHHGQFGFTAQDKLSILKDLIAADGLERYLGTRYVGQKRFSLEGGDALIPMLRAMIHRAGEQGVNELVLGMAHRGRLNVLVNVLGKEPGALFEEFEGKVKLNRTGDVKYHMGFSSDIRTAHGAIVHIALAFNPSHLEIIGPVVEGSVRSRQYRRHALNPKNTVVPIVIHGDAAFTGQGVVMETFNFSQTRGYTTGGTVHIVINNQIGFTTSDPQDSRSTRYCTDIAKMVEAPVLHVNGDDPEAVVFAIQTAFDYRMTFHRDVVVDLVCYRRHGHNEADEPAITQPEMYEKIKSMKILREIYADRLIASGLIDVKAAEMLVDAYRTRLDQGLCVVETVQDDYEGKCASNWSPYLDAHWTSAGNTTIDHNTLMRLANALTHIPENFTVHSVVKRLLADRDRMTAAEIPMNWGYAETMAYAALLDEGYGVRISGQDSERGTFAHRHAVLHDVKTGEQYIPLMHISTLKNKPFEIIDSVLSEEAVLAFEYGFATAEPHALVVWEAQFGDFANGAQVVIDQFISSGEQKWGQLCGLVMLLPHGYEGQGPEHSSARLERYLQLCAQHNIQVCTPTTPAQIFHLLRRQMKRQYRKPLIVMTPKSLLRHKLAVSPLDDLINGKFHTVIPEVDKLDAKKITRVVLCCGKVYYDLLQKRRDESLNTVAIIRIEQLYPFPTETLSRILAKYSTVRDIVWCQEEPQNQGAWFSSQHHLIECLQDNQTLTYAGREFAAAPAVGSLLLHLTQQEALVRAALGLKTTDQQETNK